MDSLEATTTVPHTILFLCSPGDEEQIEACRSVKAKVEVVSWPADRSDYPKKMNLGYKLTKSKYILMGADDIAFRDGWDVNVIRVAENTGLGVIGTNDLANRHVMKGHFSTHCLIRRSYVKKPGASIDGPNILISESYDHNYCDRELCALAQSRKQWVFARDSLVQHQHPMWRTARWDTTYHKGRRGANKDHENFLMRSAQWGHTGVLAQEMAYINRASKRHARLRAGNETVRRGT
jgi:hypothetical protein